MDTDFELERAAERSESHLEMGQTHTTIYFSGVTSLKMA